MAGRKITFEHIGFYPIKDNECFAFYYKGKRLRYDSSSWILTDSRHTHIPCSEFEARNILNRLRAGEVKGFGYSSESLERALEMFNKGL